MKKIAILLLTLATLGLTAREPLKVGVILPMSGG